jgi:hypothetical protein
MQYRVAVAYQNVAWEKGSTELSKLFASMKKEECSRRMNLREYLVAFVQRQQRLFHGLPAVQNPVLEELAGRKMSMEETEEIVQSAIRDRAQKFQRMSDSRAPAGGALGPGLSGVKVEDGDFTLESPLTSDLLCQAKVLERKSTGAKQGWKTSLAIMTADSFLHIFDVPSQIVQPGAAPEVAFHALIPNVIFPSADNIRSGLSNFSKGWSDMLTPSESVVLGNCTILLLKDGISFELHETIATTGASKMFGKRVMRKILLKTSTKEETEDWIAILREPQC